MGVSPGTGSKLSSEIEERNRREPNRRALLRWFVELREREKGIFGEKREGIGDDRLGFLEKRAECWEVKSRAIFLFLSSL